MSDFAEVRGETLGADPFAVQLPGRPYPGLRPFEIRDWPIFFGREAMTAEVIDLLGHRHFLVVHGDSGCGKSSLIRAGVQAQLEQEQTRSGHRWVAVAMRPGDSPLWSLAEALAQALGRGGDRRAVRDLRRLLNRGRDAAGAIAQALELASDQRLCLLVDQFEELFRYSYEGGGDEARLFTDCLVALEGAPPPGLYLILTMRSEFMGHCARYEGLAEAVNRGQYLLPRMDRAALVRAIREPAKLYAGEVDAALADALIADAGGGQDQLPLIQHGLMLLWGRSRSKHLGLADYTPGTGLKDLLSGHADSVMRQVTGGGDRVRAMLVEHLFRALTDAGAEGQAVRRPQTFGALKAVTGADDGALREVVDAFRAEGVSFLTPPVGVPIKDQTRIDIAHEALIRCWRRIGDPETGWLRHEFQDGLTWQSLRVQAQACERDPSQVLSAAATLELGGWVRALPSPQWTERYGGGFSEVEHLLAASEAERQRKLAESEERRRLEVRQRFLTYGVLGVSLFAFIAVGALMMSWHWYRAADAKGTALEDEVERRKALHAELEQALQRSTKLNDDLRTQIEQTTDLIREVNLQDQASATAISPDGSLVASVASDRRLALLNLKSGKAVELPPACGGVEGPELAVFSHDGRLIAAARDRDAWLMDWEETRCQGLEGHASRIRRLAFHPRGGLLATGGDDGICRVWDAQTGELVATLSCAVDSVVDLAFDPSGLRMISTGADGEIHVWHSPSGRFRDDISLQAPIDISGPPTTPTVAVDTAPTVYIHIRSEGDRLAALAWRRLLRAQGVTAPGIELVGERSPSRSELRFFRRSEEQQAAQLRDWMSRAGAMVQLKYIPGFEESRRIRPLQFEVWFADDAIGYWFPVVASVYDREQAFSTAKRAQREAAERYDVHVYAAADAKGREVYAVTLGGYMTEKEARARVAAARKGGAPDAYAWESRVWGENLWTKGPGG